ncbi:type I glyceraldehyde-3-phosphate dehydrogenase [Desulforhabdus amnigena]|jgi:glyceraldehyde 3-phosphate dehydrogenase|uniref:Glyceraldehyde-3-phosphate dehydrogenase n=1 Tax=Desulforhabdus amnigena TaxID=40218 RepID=A0A9W6FWM1_9BACT|nr:type I glyceraldehyde-3-phosphate dehydrogenase [Desulforhabdus amnigena]NLJ28896.1 type I glyceraldehyde-3-phosphate dehydrogenase [Deltaproteobacteria bacterium]GLI36187.1 type I glyceraldehyde-3-phosphate dehydrogenase [Desulforhabdus amnigena]
MSIRVAINGFGRIGRTIFKALLDRNAPLEVVALNDMAAPPELAYLLKYDSVHGVWPREVSATENELVVDGKVYKCLKVSDPAESPWHELKVDVVLESTGRFADRDNCQKHINAGARKVVLSAPGKGMDATFVIGVNEDTYDPRKHHIISNASCTTNCLAPIVALLHDHFVVEHGLMTTIHSYTMDQRLLDALHKDRRRSRAAALSMIPTTTGAARAVAEVIPELKGKLDGVAIRVPTPNVSLVDLVARVGRDVTIEEVNKVLEEAANGPLKGILNFVTEELVSSDFNHTSFSSSVDAKLTNVIGGRMVKVFSWYDNEYGYSSRLADLAVMVGKSID